MTRKTKPDKYRSEALPAAHESARDLHAAGGIDKMTLRKFDLLCLTLVEPLSASEIQALREGPPASAKASSPACSMCRPA